MDNGTAPAYHLSDIWHRRRAIGAITAICVAAVALVSLLLPRVYEASAMLLVTRPAIQTGSPPNPSTPGLQIGAMLVPEIPSQTVAAFAKSPMILSRLAATVYGGKVRASELDGKMIVRVIRGTDLLELKVREHDPVLAERAANAWAALVGQESQALFATRAEQSFRFFASRLQDARSRLNLAEDGWRRFQELSEIAVLAARVDAVVKQIAAYESHLVDLSVSLNRVETELAKTKSLLSTMPRILTLSRSITTDPFLHQAVAEAEKRSLVDLSRLQLRNEELNPAYVVLEQSRARLAVDVAATGVERARTAEALQHLNAERGDLQRRLAQQQQSETRLKREVDSLKQVYDVLLQRREEAQVAARGDASAVRVVAEPVVPDTPVAPRILLNVVLAVVLGLMVGALWAFSSGFGRARVDAPAQGRSTVPATEVPQHHARPG